MKKISSIFLALLLAACASSPQGNVASHDVALKACSDKRPKVCTKDFRPVCGFNDSGKKIKSYGNACSACADPKVLGYTTGECG